MLQDLISAQLISDYLIVELPGSTNDLEGTRRVRTTTPESILGWFIINLSVTNVLEVFTMFSVAETATESCVMGYFSVALLAAVGSPGTTVSWVGLRDVSIL